MKLLTSKLFLTVGILVLLSLAGTGLNAGPLGDKAGTWVLQPGARLYIAPMEWDLDRFVAAEIGRQGLPVTLVGRPEEADFVMSSRFQGLGSHLITPGHYIQVMIATPEGKEVWFTEANDYATFFGRLRPHGSARAASDIVKKLRSSMSGKPAR